MYNDFRDLCHSVSKSCGWWPETDERRLKIPTTLALIHTEIREAHAFHHSGEPDDHLPSLPGLVVELADIAIRTGDNAGAVGVDLESAVRDVRGEFQLFPWSSNYWTDPHRGYAFRLYDDRAYLALHSIVADATEAFRRGRDEEYAKCLGRLIVFCEELAHQHGFDLFEVAAQKIAYNQTRADHKPEVRAAAGGKIV